jgi:hypothetical protein
MLMNYFDNQPAPILEAEKNNCPVTWTNNYGGYIITTTYEPQYNKYNVTKTPFNILPSLS